ncbi:hypothetical protein NHH03_14655 [Stieleria sp. TO1_6]|uniref:hypothetical protein n=1 Tax=Stieleria tagensis TaxID=2956795 RepID=UPI00209BB754|nr:hypothetical protein [Stieleria tagensis]MCO8122986.1 hypothetical protein [Stieleria tagensis]
MPTTVDKIRRALEKRDGIAEEEMRPLADAFRSQVQEVNQRLDDAVMLLRKGLRSEAIQRVEMTPNALDAAAALDFPEWDEWNEILQFMGIPLPPKLNQDYVAQINEAIIESLPLDALLRRHRRLAIAKAPLGVRLRTLRQIARVDSGNNVWSEDVESWEKARLGQIDAELKRSLENEDARSLYQLHQELTGGHWRIAPSSRLIEQSSFAAEAHVRQNQEAELGKLAPQIMQAFENRDEANARALRTQWQTVRARFNVNVPAHLEQSVSPAMQWLEDLDRQSVIESERQMAMANLQSTLDDESPIEDVQLAVDQAKRFGQPLPEQLSQRVEELAAKPLRQRKRKTILIAVAATAVILAAIISGVMFMVSAGKTAARDETIQQMERFVSEGQFDEALNYYQSVQASQGDVASHPKMVAYRATAQLAVDKESARAERFQKLIAQASHDDPALIDQSLLPQLDELASTAGEVARVEELRNRKSDFLAAETLRQSDEMIGKLAELQRTFSQLQSRGSATENRRAVESLLSTVARLPNQFPLRSDSALAKQETFRSLVSSTLRQMKSDNMLTEQRDDAIESLIGARSLEVYSDRLRDLSTQSVSNSGFIEFETVLDEEEHWLNVDRTNVWLNQLAQKLDAGVTSSEAVGLTETAKTLQSIVNPNPAFQKMPGFFSAMAEITSRRRILDAGIQRIASHPLAKIVTLPIEDDSSRTGVMHYLIYKTYAEQNEDRMNRSGSIGVEVVSDSLGGVRNRAFQGPLPKLLDEPMKSIGEVVNNKSKNLIQYDQQWERTFLIQISEVMRHAELDAVIKEWLIYNLLTIATNGSENLKAMVPQTMQALNRRSDVRDHWYEPRPADSELPASLSRTIRSELQIAYKRLEDPLSEFKAVAEQRLEWVGFLAKSNGGQIEYHFRQALPEYDGTFYVAVPSRESGADTALFAVGELRQGHVQLKPNPVYQVPGRPLFLLPN